MKREAVQEERQRGAKMLPKQTDDVSQANPVRDLTIERLMEAEQKSENRGGDNAIPYLRVGPNSVVQSEYKVIIQLCIFSRIHFFQSFFLNHFFQSFFLQWFNNSFVSLSFHRVPFHICVKW